MQNMEQASNKYLSHRWPPIRRVTPKFSRKQFPIGPLEVHDNETFQYLIYNLKYIDYDGRFAHPQDFVFRGLYQFRNVRRRGKKEGYGVEIKRKLPGDAKRHQTTVFSRTFPNYKEAGKAHDSVERDFQSGCAETFFKNPFVKQYLLKTTKANEIRKKVRAGIKASFDPGFPKRLHFPESGDWAKMRRLNKLNQKSNFANTNYNKFQNQWTAESSRKIWKPYVTNQKGTVKGVGKTDLEAAVNFEWQVYLLNQKFREEKKQHVFNHVLHGWFDAIFDWRNNVENSGTFQVHINDNRFWNWGAIIDFNDLVVREVRNGGQFWFHGITNGVTIVSVNGRPVTEMNTHYVLTKLRDQTECDVTFAKQDSRNKIKYPSIPLGFEIKEELFSKGKGTPMVFVEPKASLPVFSTISQSPVDGAEEYCEKSKAKQHFQHLTFLLENLKATYVCINMVGRKDGSMSPEDTVKKERWEASATALKEDVLADLRELVHINPRLAADLKRTQPWFDFGLEVQEDKPVFTDEYKSMADDSDTSYYQHDAVMNSTHKAELTAFGPTFKGSNLEQQRSFPEEQIELQDPSSDKLTMEDMWKYDFKLDLQPNSFEKDSCDEFWFSGENKSPLFDLEHPESSQWPRTFESSAPQSIEEDLDSSDCLNPMSDDSEMSIDEQHDFRSSRRVCGTIVQNKISAMHSSCSFFPVESANERQKDLLMVPPVRPLEHLPYLSHEILREGR